MAGPGEATAARRAAVGAVVAAAALGALWFSPPRGDPPRPEGSIVLEDPGTFWSTWVEMVPPLRLPQDRDGEGDIRVFLALPPGGVIHTDPDGTLTFPAGTVSDRVEHRNGSVVDVRGTRLTATGELFHVYRPLTQEPGGPLFGFEWARGDAAAQLAATRKLHDAIAAGLGFGVDEAPDEQVDRDAVAARLAAFNQCDRCHGHRKPERTSATGEPPVPRRGTDGSGFYVPHYVLKDSAPLDRHRAVEANAGDPHVRFRCADGAQPVLERRTAHLACKDGSVPVGTYALAAALAAGDERARRVCASRRFLHEHLDAAGKELHAAAVAPCQALTGARGTAGR